MSTRSSSTPSLTIWLALVAGAAALSFGFVHQRRQSAEIDRLRDEVAALPRSDTRPTSTIIQIEAPPPADSHAASTAAPVTSTAAETLEIAQQQGEARVEAQKEACETAFRNEPLDATWARSTSRELTSSINAKLSEHSSISSLDCRSSTCRLEMKNADANVYRSDLKTLMMSSDPVWKGPFFATVLDSKSDGELTTVAYLVRENGSLPLPNPN